MKRGKISRVLPAYEEKKFLYVYSGKFIQIYRRYKILSRDKILGPGEPYPAAKDLKLIEKLLKFNKYLVLGPESFSKAKYW